MAFETDGSLAVDNWRNWTFRVPPTNHESKEIVELVTTPNNGLRLTVLKGKMTLTNDAPHDFNFKEMNRRIEIGSEDGEWEVVITEVEMEKGDIPAEDLAGTSFDQCRSAMGKNFEQYVKEVCSWTNKPTDADRLGAYIMWTSTVRKGGYFTSEAVLMSKLWMNKVSPT